MTDHQLAHATLGVPRPTRRTDVTGGDAPGPRGQFLLGHALDFRRDPLDLALRSREAFGDVVRYRFGPLPIYQITHPDGVEHVLRRNQRNYRRGFFHQKFKLLGGEGLVSSEGDFWLRQRRLTQPAFHRRRLEALAGRMTLAAQDAGERWQIAHRTGRPVEICREMSRITLEIVGRALLGGGLGGRYPTLRRDLLIALEYIDFRMNRPFSPPIFVPTARNRQFTAALRALDDFVYGLIERRRSDGGGDDLLSMLVSVRDADKGEGMSDRQVRDEVMTMLLAGHETSAMALSWAWYLLSQHPNVEQRLHAELDTVLGGRAPGFDDLARMPYGRMVVEETLRLYPPAWGVERRAAADDEIGGFRIRKGAQVFVSTYVTHRHPDFWPAPERFDPERFQPELAVTRPKFAYLPFGGGQRQCIGNNFALMEIQLILATLAQRYRLKVVPDHPVAVQPVITLRPRHGILMTLLARD